MTEPDTRNSAAKMRRERRLAEALRANLKRRKGPKRVPSPEPEPPPHAPAGANVDADQNRPLSPVHTDERSSSKDSS